jgi:transposase
MVQKAQEIGIKPAARELSTSTLTVRKWLRRYLAQGLDGLISQRRKPKHPRTIPQADEEKIVALRKRRKNRISCWAIKTALKLPYSTSTIYRVLRQHKLIGRRKRKHQKKNDLRLLKARLKPFEKIQVDVKYLNDIHQYYEYYAKLRFPRFLYTARCEKTGAVFFSFTYEKTNINAASFITYLLEHFLRHNITVSEIVIQSDNGTEFTGNWMPGSQSLFTHMVEKVYGAKHIKIPRGRPNYNADVESFHRIIENHFFDLEDYSGLVNFLNKAYTYQLNFNYCRPNSYKWGKTPVKILNESNALFDPAVLSFPPIILDYHSMLYLRKLNPAVAVDRIEKDLLGGYDVPDFTEPPR